MTFLNFKYYKICNVEKKRLRIKKNENFHFQTIESIFCFTFLC